MNYYMIIRPLIGAVIGYVTNWIAVKMMFRPLKAVKIGKFTLPFTPGIIPKNKERLAESIGDTISKDLLTANDLKTALLSDDIKEKIKEKIIEFLNSATENDSTIEDFISSFIGNDNYNETIENIERSITSSIYNTVLEADLGNLIANQIELAAKEKLRGSMLGVFGGNAIISSISSNVSIKLDEYITNEGENLIEKMVEKEFDKYTSKTIGSLMSDIGNSNIDLVSVIMQVYENIILEKLPTLLNAINISKIITDKINSMDVLELEKLILTIMKKELNALVNLGALIGLLLGMLNLLF